MDPLESILVELQISRSKQHWDSAKADNNSNSTRPAFHLNVQCFRPTAESTMTPSDPFRFRIVGFSTKIDRIRVSIDKEDQEEEMNNLLTPAKVLIAAGVLLAGPALLATAMGFGTAGIVAGSAAAGMQSAIGNVAAGSAFAIFQSLGATGTLVSAAWWGGSAAAAGAMAAWYKAYNEGDLQRGPLLFHAIPIESTVPKKKEVSSDGTQPHVQQQIMETVKTLGILMKVGDKSVKDGKRFIVNNESKPALVDLNKKKKGGIRSYLDIEVKIIKVNQENSNSEKEQASASVLQLHLKQISVLD
jgi:hypothetical protein